jgi:hypothetical protein
MSHFPFAQEWAVREGLAIALAPKEVGAEEEVMVRAQLEEMETARERSHWLTAEVAEVDSGVLEVMRLGREQVEAELYGYQAITQPMVQTLALGAPQSIAILAPEERGAVEEAEVME